MQDFFNNSWYLLLLAAIITILIYQLIRYKKQIQKLTNQIIEHTTYAQIKYTQLEQHSALREQEILLRNNHLETQLHNARLDLQNMEKHHKEQLAIIKYEYENKIAKQEQQLQDSHNKHMHDLITYQETYEQKLALSLQEQEQKLTLLNMQKQEALQELLNTERQKQEAILTQRFYELSDKLLEEKSKQFQEKQDISLKPLHEEITRFKNEIAQNTKENHEKQIALQTEIKHLRDTGLQISKDANNLAHALKGDSKIQGQWGEIILERLLEKSGLQKDREYYTQFTIKNENNENLRPDVVIHLPNDRFVVIDSKVSLNAYNKYYNEENNDDILNTHFESVKNHIKNLGVKNYHHYIDGKKLDFIIMFMPIEGAYNEILKKNMQIFLEAYEKGIIIAAPSTLMVILRLIYHIWSNEAKDKNFEKILDECTKLIKKFENFTDNMDKIARALDSARSAYEKADGQLRGRGSMASYLRNIDNFMSQITYPSNEHILDNENITKNSSQIKSYDTTEEQKVI